MFTSLWRLNKLIYGKHLELWLAIYVYYSSVVVMSLDLWFLKDDWLLCGEQTLGGQDGSKKTS